MVEFNNMSLTYVGTPGSNDGTYQVRLYETSGIIEYVYGSMYRNASTTTSAAIYSGFSVGSVVNTTASITTSTNTVSNGATFNVNSYTNSANIPNLHSTVDGSRRMYRFTPFNTTPVEATNLTFSAVTASTITPNWVDNSTDETYFIVTRATDASFTQNVVVTAVNSTTRLTTGTAYNVAQTGLTPSTVYYFKIQAATEANIPSVGITGSQATAAAATYYWVGTTGGNWNLPANWNTAANNTGSTRSVVATTDVLIVDGDGTTPGGSTTINVDLANFTIGQLIVNSNTNLTLQSNSTTTRTITVSGGPADDFVIAAGSTLNLTNAANAVAFAFSGTGNTGLISGTLNIGGASGNVFNSTGGTGTLVTVASTGIINNSFAGNTGVTGSVATLSFLDGSAFNASGATSTAPNVPLATWAANSTLTISGLTISTTAPTNAAQSFGNIIFNCPALTSSYPFFTTSTTGVIKGNLTVTTGSGQFRTVSTGSIDILGNVLVISGRYMPYSGAGSVTVYGNTTINAAGILDLSNAGGTYTQKGTTLTNNGAINGTNSGTQSILYFFPNTPVPQIWDGTGSISQPLNTISINNTSGLTITQTGTIPVFRLNLITGNVTGGNKFVIGNGTQNCFITIGATGVLTAGGILDSAPSWNLGTANINLIYNQCTAYTTNFEVPPTRTITNFTINNSNGVTLSGGNLDVSNNINLTLGNVTTSVGNVLNSGIPTAPGNVIGGSATSYVNGPFSRTFVSGNLNTNYLVYPVGKTNFAPVSLAPATTSIANMKVETFESNSGTADPSITSLASNRRWEAPLVSGTITDINVKLGDANLVNGNIPVQANSAAGIYTSSFGSTATFATGTPNTIQSNSTVLSGNYTGFLSYAIANVCSGTPTPGATTATSSPVCYGQTTTLGITTIPAGSGVTYQWQSSTDGIGYSDIVGATATTYVASPTVVTYYRCNVTCSAGPSTGTSSPIQITFTNNVTGTTPGSRCGAGTVTLGATPNSGAAISWYANASGGFALGSGNSFVTPTISGTTTYYAAAETVLAPFAATFGSGALTSTTAPYCPLNGTYGGMKSQYLFKASELTAMGLSGGANISNLSIELTSAGATLNGFTIQMGTTALNTLTSNIQATPTTVVNSTTYVPSVGVKTFTFDTPFVWDGTSNVIVSISWSNNNTSNTSSSVKYYATSFTSALSYRKDSETAANLLAFTGAVGSGTFTYDTSVNRPIITFAGQIICTSSREPVVATVTAPPAFALSSNTASICNGSSSSAITVSTGGTDYDTYVWSPATGVTGDSVSGWVFNPSSTTTYTLTASQSSGSLCSTSATITVTVNPLPTPVVISPSPVTVCEGVIQALSVTGGNSLISGSSTIGSATTLTTATTQPTAFCNRYEHYWSQMVFTAAELTAAGVQAGNINSIKFNITTLGDGTNVSSFKVYMANTASTTLTGFTTTGLVQVFSAATYNHTVGVNTIVFNTPFTWDGTSNVIVDIRQTGLDLANNAQTYYTATPDNKTVYAVTSTTFASSDAYAASNPAATTSLNRLNTVFDWSSSVANPITWSPFTDLYTDSGATIAYTGTNASTVYFKSSTVGTSVYTATATTGNGCPSNANVNVTVTGNRTIALSSAVGTDAQAVCINSPITNITYALGNETNANVSGLPAGVTGVYSSGLFTISGTPTAAGTFNYTVTPVGCGTAIATGSIVVNQTAQPTASSQTFCNAATVADLVATGTAIQWYSGPSGGSALASTDALATGTYYVTQTISGCESSRLAVSVTVNVTAQPTASSQTFCNAATVADLVATGTAIQWYSGPSGGSALASTDALATGTYYVTQTISGCESSRLAVSVTVNVTAAPTGSTTQAFVQGQTIADIVVAGSNVLWYPSALDAMNGTNALASTDLLVNNTTYYATQTIGGCESDASLAVTVTVTLGVSDFDTTSFKVYPNPVIDILNVTHASNISTIEVYNAIGQQVIVKSINQSTGTVDMSRLAGGTYFVKVTMDNAVKTVKVIKK